MACTECHVVPGSVADPGHLDTALPAELTFGPRATAGGAAPDFNGTTCTSVYCHGATLSGGSLTEPAWTTVDGTQAECGSCHGLPPTEGHPTASHCSYCHPSVIDDALTIINPALHVNGRTDYSRRPRASIVPAGTEGEVRAKGAKGRKGRKGGSV